MSCLICDGPAIMLLLTGVMNNNTGRVFYSRRLTMFYENPIDFTVLPADFQMSPAPCCEACMRVPPVGQPSDVHTWFEPTTSRAFGN